MAKVNMHRSYPEETLELVPSEYSFDKGWFKMTRFKMTLTYGQATIAVDMSRQDLRRIMRMMKEVDEAAP